MGAFHSILISWKSLAHVMYSQQIKVFFLVTLFASGALFYILATAFAPALVAIIIGLQWSIPVPCALSSLAYIECCAVRPSSSKKDFLYAYWCLQGIPFWIVTTAMLFFLQQTLMWLTSQSHLALSISFLGGFAPSHIFWFSPWIIFLLFFLLDSRKRINGSSILLKQTTLMLLYTYPVCLAAYGVLILAWNCVVLVIVSLLRISPMSPWPYCIAALILTPFYVALLNSLYIKQLHEQFQVYYAIS